MKTAALVLAVLLLFASQSAEFIAGFDPAGGRIWALCDNASSVFIAGQGGVSQSLALDSASQASFAVQAGGKYVVQCGKETRTVDVPIERPQAALLSPGNGWDGIAIAVGAFLIFAMLLFLFASRILFSQAFFCKSVEGRRAKIALRAGERMENVVVRDPIAIGFGGKEMEFAIPLLEQGREWEAQYAMETPQNALPAELEADCSGKRIRMLSQLIADYPAKKPAVAKGSAGKGAIAPAGKKPGLAVKKKVPKAEG